jgi:hypothetical protein
MDRGHRQNGSPEQVEGSREPEHAPRPAPGNVTRASKLSTGRGPGHAQAPALGRLRAYGSRHVPAAAAPAARRARVTARGVAVGLTGINPDRSK